MLRRRDHEPNSFYYEATANSQVKYKIVLQTPYRSTIGEDGRMAYTLDIWADGYKKLNFEWDMSGNYALRGFKKGDWVEDIALWHFGPTEEIQSIPAAAAA